MTWLIRLYPARWRARYGTELEHLVRDLRPTTPAATLAADLVRGALDAHAHQVAEMLVQNRRAITRGALIASIVWLALSAHIYLSNVVFPSQTDDDAVGVLVSYLVVFASLFLTGVLAGRDGAGRNGQIIAGAVAGIMIGALTMATFAVVDNVWLDIVAQQQAKIDGLAHSDAASMREYLNDGLIRAAAVMSVALGLIGAVLSLIGGLAGHRPALRLPRS